MKRVVVITSIAVAIVVSGIAVYLSVAEDKEGVTASTDKETGKKHRPHKIYSGPNPANQRLRDGTKQVQDPEEALRMARESLSRVEKEIGAASDEAHKAGLEEKKKIIEGIIARLENK
jgi:hypothetical protein